MEIRHQTLIPGSDPLNSETKTTEALALGKIAREMAHLRATTLHATINALEIAVS
jgi:hypothetical protein